MIYFPYQEDIKIPGGKEFYESGQHHLMEKRKRACNGLLQVVLFVLGTATQDIITDLTQIKYHNVSSKMIFSYVEA